MIIAVTFTRNNNYLDRDLDHNLDCDTEEVPIYKGHEGDHDADNFALCKWGNSHYITFERDCG